VRDGIPPIDRPRFVSQQRADEWLADNEPVLVVELDGTARAYPQQILIWHEIVNDDFAGRPIAVTFCPLCNSSLVFDRRVDGRELTFGTTGNLRHSDLVMWDRQTESRWQQIGGEAVVGELTGTKLMPLPAQTLSWEDFREKYPGGEVLSRETGFDRDYGRNPYEGYDTPNEQPFLFDGEVDGRLPAKERVAAVFAGADAVVVPFSRLRRDRVASFELAGTPVVVLFKPGVASALDEGQIPTRATPARARHSTGDSTGRRWSSSAAATSSSTARPRAPGTSPAAPPQARCRASGSSRSATTSSSGSRWPPSCPTRASSRERRRARAGRRHARDAVAAAAGAAPADPPARRRAARRPALRRALPGLGAARRAGRARARGGARR
jgi:hypothetical protein